jgi:hypothetical protein
LAVSGSFPCAVGHRPLQRAPLQTRHANLPCVVGTARAEPQPRPICAIDCAGGRRSVLEYSRLRGRTEEGTRVPTAARADGGAPTKIRSALKAYLRSGRGCNGRPMLQPMRRTTLQPMRRTLALHSERRRGQRSAVGTRRRHSTHALHCTIRRTTHRGRYCRTPAGMMGGRTLLAYLFVPPSSPHPAHPSSPIPPVLLRDARAALSDCAASHLPLWENPT